jgi:hypothetical protein
MTSSPWGPGRPLRASLLLPASLPLPAGEGRGCHDLAGQDDGRSGRGDLGRSTDELHAQVTLAFGA